MFQLIRMVHPDNDVLIQEAISLKYYHMLWVIQQKNKLRKYQFEDNLMGEFDHLYIDLYK